MKHGKAYSKLGRETSHRLAMLKNLTISFIKAEKIKTNLARAKSFKSYFEKIVTKAKKADGNLILERELRTICASEEVFLKLLKTIAPKYKDRNGGYLRVIKLGFRHGDKADVALVEFV